MKQLVTILRVTNVLFSVVAVDMYISYLMPCFVPGDFRFRIIKLMLKDSHDDISSK